jgi:hypothetical protein
MKLAERTHTRIHAYTLRTSISITFDNSFVASYSGISYKSLVQIAKSMSTRVTVLLKQWRQVPSLDKEEVPSFGTKTGTTSKTA